MFGSTPQEILTAAGLPQSNVNSVGSFVGLVANLVMGLGFAAGFGSIVYSAVLYANSEGSPDKTKQAWSAFIFGIIAMAIAVGAVALKNIVASTVGVSISTGQPDF